MASASKAVKYVAAAVVVVVIATAGVWYVVARYGNPFSGGRYGDPFTEEKTVRRDLTLAQAQKECPIPLPAGATNISFARWGEGTGFEDYVRFEAPPQICLAHVAVVLSGPQSSAARGATSAPSPRTSKITSSPSPIRSANVDVSWFDVQNIRSGVTAGEGGSHKPTIWVDTERGVFYYHLTD